MTLQYNKMYKTVLYFQGTFMVVLWAKRQILRLYLINKKGPIDQAGHAASKVFFIWPSMGCCISGGSEENDTSARLVSQYTRGRESR